MRLFTLPKLLLLGGALALVLGKRRRDRATGEPTAIPNSMDNDPNDPVQGIDEVPAIHVEDLAVDARSAVDVEIAEDLAALDAEYDANATELDTPSQTDLDAITNAFVGDDGELYGVHTPRAVDREISDGDGSNETGESWLEALQASAAENGAEPERDIDVADDVLEPPHPSDTRDIPVADRGSGGPRGV